MEAFKSYPIVFNLLIIGNERMANGTWITQSSVPMTPTGIQPPVEASFMDYFTLKIKTIDGNKVVVPSYGSPNEMSTAVCEYGKKLSKMLHKHDLLVII